MMELMVGIIGVRMNGLKNTSQVVVIIYLIWVPAMPGMLLMFVTCVSQNSWGNP